MNIIDGIANQQQKGIHQLKDINANTKMAIR